MRIKLKFGVVDGRLGISQNRKKSTWITMFGLRAFLPVTRFFGNESNVAAWTSRATSDWWSCETLPFFLTCVIIFWRLLTSEVIQGMLRLSGLANLDSGATWIHFTETVTVKSRFSSVLIFIQSWELRRWRRLRSLALNNYCKQGHLSLAALFENFEYGGR